jgi:hypothetical protein
MLQMAAEHLYSSVELAVLEQSHDLALARCDTARESQAALAHLLWDGDSSSAHSSVEVCITHPHCGCVTPPCPCSSSCVGAAPDALLHPFMSQRFNLFIVSMCRCMWAHITTSCAHTRSAQSVAHAFRDSPPASCSNVPLCVSVQTTIMTQDGCYLSPVVPQCRAALNGVLKDGLVPAVQLYFTLISGVLSKRAAQLNTTLAVRRCRCEVPRICVSGIVAPVVPFVRLRADLGYGGCCRLVVVPCCIAMLLSCRVSLVAPRPAGTMVHVCAAVGMCVSGACV